MGIRHYLQFWEQLTVHTGLLFLCQCKSQHTHTHICTYTKIYMYLPMCVSDLDCVRID